MNDGDEAILAGLDDLRARDQDWVQLELAASVTAAELAAALREPLQQFGPQRWWFVRKAPGMRVRIEAAGVDRGTVLVATRQALAGLGAVRSSPYEPETYRFGGPAGMDVAHDHFALDSALAAALSAARSRVARPVTAARWSMAMLGDLSARVVDDAAEHYDAWKRLEEVLSNVGAPPIVDRRRSDDHGDEGNVPTRLAAALQQGNERVARRLQQSSLEHGVGRRSWFAAVAVFHWNRLGFGPADMAGVVAAMLEGLGEPG